MIQDYSTVLEEKNIQLKKSYSKNLWAHVDVGALTICFQNIFSNAIRYNSQNGNIYIQATKNMFLIRDSGQGIDQENTEKIFERNY